MKTTNKLYSLLLLGMISSTNCFAQFETNLFENNFPLVIETTKIISQETPLNNLVLIQQIGDNNRNTVQTNFTSGKISVVQEGNENESTINRFGNNILENVYQNGTNNLFHDNALQSNPSNISINQTGSDLSIYNSGSNSISNSMSITQKGNSQMIIILNN